MGKLLDLKEQRWAILAKRGLKAWSQRFDEDYGPQTNLSHLSDRALAFLIQGNEESNALIHDLVMGVKGLGPSLKFQVLDNRQKMDVMDIALFVLDQLRFQAMRRLGWVEDSPFFSTPLVQMLEEFHSSDALVPQQPPKLSKLHPLFDDYERTFDGDRGPFIRRLIPQVIEVYAEKIREGRE